MVERPQQILSRDKIHGSLAANGGIDLREHGRWNLHQLDAAHVKRGQESADVADHTAAECDDDSLAVSTHARQLVGEGLDRGQALGWLAVHHRNHLRRESRGFERSHEFCSPALAYWRNRHNKDAAGLR